MLFGGENHMYPMVLRWEATVRDGPTSPLTSSVTLQFSSLVIIPAIFDIIRAVLIVASHDNDIIILLFPQN